MNDAAVEPDEMFQVVLSSDTAAITGEATATVTITDSDSTLELYIHNIYNILVKYSFAMISQA